MEITRREALKIAVGAALAGPSGNAEASPASAEVTPLGGLIPTRISVNSPGEITPRNTHRQILVSVGVAERLADELLKNGQDIPTPTGSVRLSFGDLGVVTQPVKRGGSAFALDWLPAGTHDLEVIYPAHGRFDSCRSG